MVVERGIKVPRYQRLCLVLREEMVSRERRADVFCTSIPEGAKLETGSISKEVKTHMTGANDIVSARELPALGTAR